MSSSSSPSPKRVPWKENAFRQLKLVVPGALLTYYLGTLHEFWSIVIGLGGSWGRTIALGALGHGITTLALFLYILFLPWLTGVEPNYQAWRESGVLSSVIPVLTASIVIGWLLGVLTLGQWSNLGYIRGIVGVSSVYALTFGLLGLLPIPKTGKRKS
ncbi:hypothetical protein BDQ12DRAFT_680790 [Crucibulum laeve]|uniref:Uncharacterized protein n=1 Tax=Crucibulum laeve TaxID=68775 RepID=A0A5C3M625_9AGAR|nr:hypothetical protein BDQ12DRAFT_680790 [Crucibulum laeve]